ncbi:MAG: plastocyanin/azurin family copper-binding protein [Actinomycetota bacterium]|nr:plastocyanin/azurin family copper-binding protein [Actinomycetota bacterium]
MRKMLKAVFYVLLISLAACGSQEATSSEPAVIRVVDDEFSPKIIRVEPGTTVIWESGGANNHNVIASDGSWQAISSDYFEYGIITKGDQYEHTFTDPGIYEYYCPFHGTNDKGMVGLVIVGDVEYSVEEAETKTELSKNVLTVNTRCGQFFKRR